MKTKNLIAVNDFCISHGIEISFISSLQVNGLLEIITVKETAFIDTIQLQKLEKFIRLFYDLDINLEGIETVTHLLERTISMQQEIIYLRNRLRLYEKEDGHLSV